MPKPSPTDVERIAQRWLASADSGHVATNPSPDCEECIVTLARLLRARDRRAAKIAKGFRDPGGANCCNCTVEAIAASITKKQTPSR